MSTTTTTAAGPARTAVRARASVIIPAHDEATVLARTLAPLADAVRHGELEVIVVCNGCGDASASAAAAVPGVIVIETDAQGKPGALNLGDAAATAWPRIYLDADIESSAEALQAVARVLEASGTLLAARPPARYDTRGAAALVRAYYRARVRIPSGPAAMWGAGVYGLSELGHRRLGAFPELAADDLWVDRLFAAHEKAVVDAEAVVVRTPRTLAALLAITRRNSRGARLANDGPSSAAGTVRGLLRSVRGPRAAADALVYLGVALASRTPAPEAGKAGWERDDTSR